MKILSLACPGVIKNDGKLTIVAVLPFHDGSGAVPLSDTAAAPVSVVPLLLEQDTNILLMNWIDDSFRRGALFFTL